MKLGRLELCGSTFLAPLERVSYVAFRNLCARNGASLTFTEMVRCKSVTASMPVVDMMDTVDSATPTGVQLLAADARELAACLKAMERAVEDGTRPHWANICCIDLNFGCPKPEIVKYGLGPAMLKNTERVSKMFETLANFKETTSTLKNVGAVGAKVRLGMTRHERLHERVLSKLMPAANDCLDWITVHARDAEMLPNEPAVWEEIAAVKAAATPRLKVIGNGDVRDCVQARRMREQTGCDGVMPAPTSNDSNDLEFRWFLRLVETVGRRHWRVFWKTTDRASTFEQSIVRIGDWKRD